MNYDIMTVKMNNFTIKIILQYLLDILYSDSPSMLAPVFYFNNEVNFVNFFLIVCTFLLM